MPNEQQLSLLEDTEPSPSTESSTSTLVPEQTLEPECKIIELNLDPLHRLANHEKVTIPRNPHFTRKDVVQSFQSAFELIGGIPRLAIWANNNETDFFKLYARLLPSQASSSLGEANVMRIEMAIKPGPLDQ
jgi:hypothetical protein